MTDYKMIRPAADFGLELDASLLRSQDWTLFAVATATTAAIILLGMF
jgi:hypothetical protein